MKPNPTAAVAILLCFALAETRATAQVANPSTYLGPVITELKKDWPSNRTVNLVFHGHSVPAGYFKTPEVDVIDAYPHQLQHILAKRFPHAPFNVIVTAVGGETADRGAARFERDVLTHKPDVVFIDYALNDRGIGLEKARVAWEQMIQQAQAAGAKVILLTPTPDERAKLDDPNDPLNQHAEQIRKLAAQYHVGLVDSLAAFKTRIAAGATLESLMSQVNHPNAEGHALVATELAKWFASSQ